MPDPDRGGKNGAAGADRARMATCINVYIERVARAPETAPLPRYSAGLGCSAPGAAAPASPWPAGPRGGDGGAKPWLPVHPAT